MRCFLFSVTHRRSYSSQATISNVKSQVVLRPYQHECIQSCLDALASGCTRIGVSLPTGSGKTTVFLSLLSRILSPPSNPQATRCLVIVNSIELARQSAEQAARLFPHWDVEIEQGAKHNASGIANLTVATYQTLNRAERINKFDPSKLKAIIIDEAHHSAAPSYRKLLSRFHSGIPHPDPTLATPIPHHPIPIIGFSATFSRHDGLGLDSVFERIVYHRDFLEMIKGQWLCDIRFTMVKASLNLNEVSINSQTGDFNPNNLAQQLNKAPIRELLVKSWIDRAADRKSTLVFCVNIDHVRALTEMFRKYGVDARYVDSQTNPAERKARISQFKQGVFPVLVNCAILTEGTDIPNIDCVVLAKPTRSPNLYTQMIGRGMRLSLGTGKTDCRILDFADASSNMTTAISLPTLCGLDPKDISEEENLSSLAAKSNRKAATTPDMDDVEYLSDERFADTTITYVDYENPFSMVEDSSGAPNLFKLTRNAWVGCGEDTYVLPCLQHGDVRIQPMLHTEGQKYFSAFFIPRLDEKTAKSLKTSTYMRRRHVLNADNLVQAVRGCDTYVSHKVLQGPLSKGVLRTAQWRTLPASDAQKKFITSRWANKGKKVSLSQDDIQAMTKGEAANIITRLKHGAQMRYEKKMKEITKVKTIILNEQARLAKYKVKIGPLAQ